MGILSVVFESEDIIGTGFYGSLENIWPTAVNVYRLVKIMFYYKALIHFVSSIFLLLSAVIFW